MDENELLARAWSAVEQSEVPEELQAQAFEAALDHLRSEADPPSTRADEQTPPPADREEDGSGSGGDNDVVFRTLAEESGVDLDEIKMVLSYADDQFSVGRPARALGTNKAQQTRTIAALVAGARKGGLSEEAVDVESIRRVCKDRGCYDSGNFTTHLDGLARFTRTDNTLRAAARWYDEFDDAVALAIGRGG